MASKPLLRVGERLALRPMASMKIEVRVEYLLRCPTAQHPDKQCDDSFGDDRVAVGREPDFAVFVTGVDPNPRLAALDQVLIRAVLGCDGRERVAQSDQVFVFVEPFIEYRKFFDDLVLSFVVCHG